jgi:hypothetical protein
VPSIHTQVTLPSGPSVHVHGLHPRPPHPSHDPDTTERDAELQYDLKARDDHREPTADEVDEAQVQYKLERLHEKRRGRPPDPSPLNR